MEGGVCLADRECDRVLMWKVEDAVELQSVGAET